MTRRRWIAMGGYGSLITVAVLAALGIAIFPLDMGRERAVTVSFLILAFAQPWHVFDMCDHDGNVLRNEITRNPYIWGALLLCTGLLLLAVYLPGLSTILKTVDPGSQGWMLVLGMSLLPVAVGQTLKELGIGRV